MKAKAATSPGGRAQLAEYLNPVAVHRPPTGRVDRRGGEDAGGDSPPYAAHAVAGEHVQGVIEPN